MRALFVGLSALLAGCNGYLIQSSENIAKVANLAESEIDTLHASCLATFDRAEERLYSAATEELIASGGSEPEVTELMKSLRASLQALNSDRKNEMNRYRFLVGSMEAIRKLAAHQAEIAYRNLNDIKQIKALAREALEKRFKEIPND